MIEKKVRGRPRSNNKRIPITLRLPVDIIDWLSQYQRRGVMVEAAIRAMIKSIDEQ